MEDSYKKGKQLINYVFHESDSTLCLHRRFPAMFSGTGNSHEFAQNYREDISDQHELILPLLKKKQVLLTEARK